MAALDVGIICLSGAVMLLGALASRRYMRSVADYLAAGRSAGRYLVSVSQGVARLGAISVVGLFEMNYVAGFAMTWWSFTMNVVILLAAASGWVIYRFRQTRSLTLAEFFERRYSRSFRIFCGMLAFVSGIINFGIFPAVGARFFIYFCGIPAAIPVAGFELPSLPVVMFLLVAVALLFVLWGGQVVVIVSDFVQGTLANVFFLAASLYLLLTVSWSDVSAALQQAPENESLINPFKTSHVEDFNLVYFVIGVVGFLYNSMSWQGTQAYNASATSAHEAKMGQVLSIWRIYPQDLFLLVAPVIAYTVMHGAAFEATAATVQGTLDTLPSETLQNQLRVPLVLREMLPVGLIGGFAAAMLAAFVSTHDTYLHSWGSIFVQDVIMPFRKEPLTPGQHLRYLRYAVIGVAVFIYCFSLLFQQSQYIFLFFALTGAIFVGGSGAVIIGGLYWRRGTVGAAWSAMIAGSSIATGGIIVRQLDEDFWLNGQEFWALAMGVSTLVYVGVSLASKECFDLDRLLNREPGGERVHDKGPVRWKRFGIGKEFGTVDKATYLVSYAWTFSWTLLFVVGTAYSLNHDVGDSAWAGFWKTYVYIQASVAAAVIVWFVLGGMRDISRMFRALGAASRDVRDDGFVVKGPRNGGG